MLTRVVVFIGLIIIGFLLVRLNKKSLTIVITIVYTFALLYYTFFSRMGMGPASDAVNSYESASSVRTLKDVLKEIFVLRTYDFQQAFILNILLFVPLGYLIYSYFRKLHWWQVVLIGLFCSFAIEILQEMTGYGMFDPRDILANTIGAAIGGVIMLLYRVQGCRNVGNRHY